MNIAKSVFVSLILFWSNTLYGGWILTGRYIDQEGKTILQRWFIQDYKVKFEQYDIIYTFNLNTGEIILVDPVNLVYHQTSINSLISAQKEYKKGQLEVLLENIPSENREDIRQEYLQFINQFGNPPVPEQDSLSVFRVNDTLKALGKPTEKYQINLEGRKMEEIWISPSLDLRMHYSWEKYLYFYSVIDPGNRMPAYMYHPDFLSLLDKGFPVRRIILKEGYKTEVQINRMEEKTIPDYEFFTPSQCRKVSYAEWLGRDDPEYDDYE